MADTLYLKNSLVDHVDVTLQKTEELATSLDMKLILLSKEQQDALKFNWFC